MSKTRRIYTLNQLTSLRKKYERNFKKLIKAKGPDKAKYTRIEKRLNMKNIDMLKFFTVKDLFNKV